MNDQFPHTAMGDLQQLVFKIYTQHVSLCLKAAESRGVGVAVERLHAEPASHVPQTDRLVAGRRADVHPVGLESDAVHRVHVAAERLSALHGREIEDARRVIHTRGHHELMRLVEIQRPRSQSVLGEGVGAPGGRFVCQGVVPWRCVDAFRGRRVRGKCGCGCT